VPVAVSAVLAVPLLLVLPGLALLDALGAGALGASRLVLVPGLSIAVDIVIALVLDALPGGLTAHSWAIAVVIVVLAASATAAVRGVGIRESPLRLDVGLRDLAVLAAAAIVLVGALVIMRTPLSADTAKSYTILSMTRTSPAGVQVEVQSGEFEPTRYRLVVRSLGSGLHRVERFTLAPGSRMSVTIPAADAKAALVATLYRGDGNTSYRRVELAPRRPAS
jgi:hypothetical protein